MQISSIAFEPLHQYSLEFINAAPSLSELGFPGFEDYRILSVLIL